MAIRICRSSETPLEPTRRPGIAERRLLTAEASDSQNVILVEVAAGAEVEDHPIATSESIFVLEGAFVVAFEGREEALGVGELVHFPSGSSHSLRCIATGRLLVVWAPPVGAVQRGGA